jgi:drug/metabolite transporter (DMT)-like permease
MVGLTSNEGRRLTSSAHGALLMVCVTVGYASIAALSKLLMQRYPVVMVAWVRYAVPWVIAAIAVYRHGELRPLRSADPVAQGLRSLLMISGTVLIMLAYRALPLAQALSISSIHPLLLTVWAACMLHERVSRLAWASVVLGFAGVLIIVRPGGGMFTPAALLPLGMAATYSGYMALTRRLARRETPKRSLLYGMSIGALLTTLLLPLTWVTPDIRAVGLFVLVGVLSGATHWLMIKALDAAPASTLAPLSYLQLIWSIALGALFFGEMPDELTLAGIGVVIASGLLLAAAQHRRSAPSGLPHHALRASCSPTVKA